MKPDEPIFKQVLGPSWERLAPVIKRHYFLRPYSTHAICVEGVMSSVWHSVLAKLFLPFGLVFGALVPHQGRDVPIQVYYSARRHNAILYWERVFHFPGKRPFIFRSCMRRIANNEVIEYVRFGLGVRLMVTEDQGGMLFTDKGYVWRLGRWHIPLPLGLLLGKTTVAEMPLSDNVFRMRMDIVHPLFGKTFHYVGQFSLPAAA